MRALGIATYRYYIDGEQEASIVFTPRMAVGMGFPPAGTSGGGGGGGGSRDDEFVIGGRGQSCDDACRGTLRHCNPVLEPDNRTGTLGDFMSRLVRYDTGAACSVDSTPWWAEDQPSYVWDPSDGNYGKCLGTFGTPRLSSCNSSFPKVQRLCRCSPDAYEDSTPGQEFGLRSIGSEENSPSAPVPWGTGWIGKTSDMDGYYSNVKVPFYRAIRVTAQLPPGTKPFNVYTIFRGVENVPVTVGGFELPPGALLRTHSNTNLAVPSLEFVPIVNDSSNGSGLILYHTLAFSGMPSFTYLEGCFHLLTPYTKPLVANGVSGNFPGVILSTGMEDYYDSSFYFHAGLFQLPVSGITHMCHGAGASSPPHPACPGAASGSQVGSCRPSADDRTAHLSHADGESLRPSGAATASMIRTFCCITKAPNL